MAECKARLERGDAALTVFTGLSLALSRAGEFGVDHVCGPAQAGDLDSIQPPAKVAIIDGVLEPGARISLGEVRRAMARGIQVSGAASVGAVLAVELEAEGMKGAGRVFEFLKAYGGDGEDLVKVIYRCPGFSVVTQPLINVAVAMRDAGIGNACRASVLEALVSIPLVDRKAPRIVETLQRFGVWPMSIPDHKAEDAASMLARLRHRSHGIVRGTAQA